VYLLFINHLCGALKNPFLTLLFHVSNNAFTDLRSNISHLDEASHLLLLPVRVPALRRLRNSNNRERVLRLQVQVLDSAAATVDRILLLRSSINRNSKLRRPFFSRCRRKPKWIA